MTIHNFSAGPAILPATVLVHAQEEFRNYQKRGMSIMEMSHRTPEYESLNREAEAAFLRLAGVSSGYRAIFLQGGASLQFTMLPMNLLPPGACADIILSGAWAEKAIEGAQQFGDVHVVASTKATGYRHMPEQSELQFSANPAYVHLTSNETIQGIQWHQWPDVGERLLVADMSSDIFSRPLEAERFGLIYAGAQKNLGPAGVTVVLLREELLERMQKNIPTILRYGTHVKNNSLYNTPPTFAVYMLGLVLQWIEELGGLEVMQRRNAHKAGLVYAAIDGSSGFYRGHAKPDHRSLMNITFRLPDETLEQQFVTEAAAEGMVGLAGHRSVGGIRASLYNALEPASALVLAQFMGEFMRRHG